MGSVYPGLVSRGEVEEVTALLESLFVCSYLGQDLDGQGAPIKAEWAPPMINAMLIV